MLNFKEKYFAGYGEKWENVQSIPFSPYSHCFDGPHVCAVSFILTLVTAFSYVSSSPIQNCDEIETIFNQPIFCDVRMRINHMQKRFPYKTVFIYCKIVLYRFELKKTKGMDSKANIRTLQAQI